MKLLQWSWVWNPTTLDPRRPEISSSRHGQMPMRSALGGRKSGHTSPTMTTSSTTDQGCLADVHRPGRAPAGRMRE